MILDCGVIIGVVYVIFIGSEELLSGTTWQGVVQQGVDM
jgi:hypothetical protein